MIKVVFFDLGGTLVDAQHRPFAHVAVALATLQGFHTAAGRPLRSALVSDFDLVPPPATASAVAAVFAQYLAMLKSMGLRDFFEPVARRVTLSTHAGVMKPARAVFDKALRRLQSKTTLTECLFITEDAAHIAAARLLGLHTLRFSAPGSPGAAQADFTDWSLAPALVAHLLGASNDANVHAAIGAHLAARGVDVAAVHGASAAHEFTVQGHTWHAVPLPGHRSLKSVWVALPVQARVRRGLQGALQAEVQTAEPAPTATPTPRADGGGQGVHDGADTAAVEEATAFVASLAAHGQIEGMGAVRSAGAPTHRIETDDQGRCKLVRKRFTAF